MNKSIIKALAFLDKIPFWVSLSLLILFSCSNLNEIDFKWYFIHRDLFFILIGFLLTSLLNIKHTNLIFLLTWIFAFFIRISDIFKYIADGLFFKASFKDIFQSITAKDENVVSLFIIIILSALLFLWEITNISFFKKYNLKRIFILLTSGSIILTTVVFHYFIIHVNLNRDTDKIISQLIKTGTSPENNILKLCDNQGYKCILSNNIHDFDSQPAYIKEFANRYIQNNNKIGIYGHFLIGENNFIAVFRKDNIWIFDDIQYLESFKNAEKIFLSLCVLAHSFWLIFLSFLILFHHRRNKSKIINR